MNEITWQAFQSDNHHFVELTPMMAERYPDLIQFWRARQRKKADLSAQTMIQFLPERQPQTRRKNSSTCSCLYSYRYTPITKAMQAASFIGSNKNISSIEGFFDFTWLATVVLTSISAIVDIKSTHSSLDTSHRPRSSGGQERKSTMDLCGW